MRRNPRSAFACARSPAALFAQGLRNYHFMMSWLTRTSGTLLPTCPPFTMRPSRHPCCTLTPHPSPLAPAAAHIVQGLLNYHFMMYMDHTHVRSTPANFSPTITIHTSHNLHLHPHPTLLAPRPCCCTPCAGPAELPLHDVMAHVYVRSTPDIFIPPSTMHTSHHPRCTLSPRPCCYTP